MLPSERPYRSSFWIWASPAVSDNVLIWAEDLRADLPSNPSFGCILCFWMCRVTCTESDQTGMSPGVLRPCPLGYV